MKIKDADTHQVVCVTSVMKTPVRKPKEETISSIAIVQIMLSQWSKSSRGGSAAVERNKMPEVLPLPSLHASIQEPSFVIHSVRKMYDTGITYYERTPGKELLVQSLAEPFECDCVRVSLRDAMLHVDFQWKPNAGMPERYPKNDILALPLGQWGQLRYNERHSPYCEAWGESATWWYEKWVFNIGLFSAVSPAVFVESEPTQVYSMMDHMR